MCFFLHNFSMSNNKLCGMLLMEVLIALGIVSTVLFSLLFYFVSHTQAMRAVYLRSIADIQLANFAENIISYDQWCANNRLLLPHAHSTLKKLNNHQCELTVYWIYHSPASESLKLLC